MSVLLDGTQDQDPEEFQAGTIREDSDGLPGGIHDHHENLRKPYRHSHPGWQQRHHHPRDES